MAEVEMHMTDEKRRQILEKAKIFFKNTIARNHVKNTQKLGSLNQFKVNPFLYKYIANFAFGDSSPESIAKALIYPRALGTSISTSFGSTMQNFCNDVLEGYASLVSGIDIEFVDAVDGRRKFCQIKSGPQTINKDDVNTIFTHFDGVTRLARANQQREINPTLDCIVGVLYGTREDLSAFYKKLNKRFPVFCGKNFWYRLTGDENFYHNLIKTFAEVAVEIDGREILGSVVSELAAEIMRIAE